MAAEKFIRVKVTLPVGVTLITASKSSSGTLLGPFLRGDLSDYVATRETSTGPLELTLECPQEKRDELIDALGALVRDLRAS